MNLRLLSVLLGGSLVIALTVWMTYPSKPKSIKDVSKARFMHCPECMREKMYSPSRVDEKCLYCEKDLILTTEPVAKLGAGPSPFNKMAMLVFAELVVVMAGVWFTGRKRSTSKDDELIYTNCEKCRQKIRYRDRQIGNAAMCPRCKHPFMYPEVDDQD